MIVKFEGQKCEVWLKVTQAEIGTEVCCSLETGLLISM